MADRKRGEEPSLFDLPLRPGEARGGSAEEHHDERPEDPSKDPSAAPPEGRPAPAADEAAASSMGDEPPFWEREEPAAAEAAPAAPAPDPHRHQARGGRRGAGPGLFDDEADPPPRPERAAPAETAAPPAAPAGGWADVEAGADPEAPEGLERDPAEEAGPGADAGEPVPAPLTHRLAAALLDGGLLLVVTAAAILGAVLFGVRWDGEDLAPLAMFLLVFSFVYSVMPLAFWGRTPGMALARVLARGADGGPLTFGQTALRWLGGLLTVALAGLPLLLALPALGGRSLADRLSGSHTWLQP